MKDANLFMSRFLSLFVSPQGDCKKIMVDPRNDLSQIPAGDRTNILGESFIIAALHRSDPKAFFQNSLSAWAFDLPRQEGPA